MWPVRLLTVSTGPKVWDPVIGLANDLFLLYTPLLRPQKIYIFHKL